MKNNPDLEDDVFDDIDFDDTDLEDDAVYDDIDDADIEADLAAENFDDEWDEEEGQPTANKKRFGKEKSLYTDTSERKSFLNMSFNTMVIAGAVLLGGSVLVYTVMSKSAEVNAGKPAGFFSSLNIASVMDGSIFGLDGSSTEEQTALDPVQTGEQQPAPDAGGFLNNPEDLNAQQPVITDGTPPMPSPIAPSETAATDPLTPMPVEGEQVPRGPDEVSSVGAQEEPRRAEDILKEAMANRAEKNGEAVPVEAPVVEAVAEQPIIPAPVVAEETAPEVVPPVAVAPEPIIQRIVEQSPEDKAKLIAATQAAEAAKEEVKNLQKTIDDLQSKVGTLEGELGSVKQSKDSEVQNLQQTVADLKEELTTLKNKPVPKAELKKQPVISEAEEEVAAPAPVKKKVVKKTAPKAEVAKSDYPTPAPAVQSASQRWELRAAQPGKAWVSKPGARDMQGVGVGETLPGIGRITAISYLNGRWTVQGTQGQILQ